MAIVVRTAIESADQVAHDRLDQAVETALARQGAPPDGLMVHLAYPSGRGFMIVEVWRSEDAFRSSWNDLVEPALAEVGLTAGEQEISPMWSLARP
ncbi:MAG TPA: hypothetical protein VF711_06625 [Acidimicrobiales bacterium]|jgi:hypothetical protein